jgi:radical SAM superfamily enzyme YgiQ (UPF0313 family)
MNSKYIHSSLGAWYLKAACDEENIDVDVMQCTINDSMEHVLANIYRRRPEILAFSCYIWNMVEVLRLCENIKKLLPGLIILLGGPEVSFDSGEVMEKSTFIDYIIKGEGEETFPALLNAIEKGLPADNISSICSKAGDSISDTGTFGIVSDLDSIPTPYTHDMLSNNAGKIIYFEASRGCPFNCSYCLSSTFDGVRYFSMERVKRDLETIVSSGAKQIKFVDRTFNANRKRAKEILKYIKEAFGHMKNINFHFEVAADLFDDEMLKIVKKLPTGLIQFEVGVQTTNEEALCAVKRKTDTKKVLDTLSTLLGFGNVHVHADLIAGLPKEDIMSFKKSFEDLYHRAPHQLQLGFLKLLRGSDIRREYQKYGYIFKSTPPYEVLSNNLLSFDDILELKRVEEMVERLYNSNRYRKSLEYLINAYGKGAYCFYKDFGSFYEEKGFFERGISARELYALLLEFGRALESVDKELLTELLVYDYLSADNTGNIPPMLKVNIDKAFRDNCFEFLRNPANVERYLPDMISISSKEIYKNVYFLPINHNFNLSDGSVKSKSVILFDYTRKDRVTGLYLSFHINI